MTNRVRPYAWGSRTALAELLGNPVPSPHPEAELWIGAHPGEPSRVQRDGVEHSLADIISADPVGTVGPAQHQAFGARLSFLLKVLAAAEPLSLQAHPTPEQARQGYAAEEAAGVALTSPHRNYKDTFAKPELICALSEMHALCGFRDPARTVALLTELDAAPLNRYLQLLAGQPDEHGLRALFSSLITMPPVVLNPLLDSVVAACIDRVRAGTEYDAEYRTALELGERYPGDAGVVASLLMNRLTLQPGQAVYLGAGNLHAYLSGVGVEIMANSDNVLRGGLTPKHVDVPELMRVLDFSYGPVPVIEGEQVAPGVCRYPTPAAEFALFKLEPAGVGSIPVDHRGPRVVLTISGSITVTAAGTQVQVPQGRSVFLTATEGGATVTGDGVAFLATDGLPDEVAAG